MPSKQPHKNGVDLELARRRAEQPRDARVADGRAAAGARADEPRDVALLEPHRDVRAEAPACMTVNPKPPV